MSILNTFDLTGKTAIVTGGGRGLGKGIAEGLCEAGASVVIIGSQRCLYLIQSNDSRDFEHPRVHFNRCCTDWLSS